MILYFLLPLLNARRKKLFYSSGSLLRSAALNLWSTKQPYHFRNGSFNFSPMVQQPPPPPLGQWSSLSRIPDHNQTHHSRQDSSRRVISPSQRPLPDNTQHSQQTRHPWSRRDSNPKSQQASRRRSTPLTARPTGSALKCSKLLNFNYRWGVTLFVAWRSQISFSWLQFSSSSHNLSQKGRDITDRAVLIVHSEAERNPCNWVFPPKIRTQ